jgi:hypothetical protein
MNWSAGLVEMEIVVATVRRGRETCVSTLFEEIWRSARGELGQCSNTDRRGKKVFLRRYAEVITSSATMPTNE